MTTEQWTLEEGLSVVRSIQWSIKRLGFHVALAGGVLNNGVSNKDLDLVFLPLTNAERPKLADICTWLFETWGSPQDNLTDADPCVSYRHQASHIVEKGPDAGKRIDVFVV